MACGLTENNRLFSAQLAIYLTLANIMKKILKTLIIFISYTIAGCSQTSNIELLSNKMCLKFNESDLNKTKPYLQQYVKLKSNELYLENDELLLELKKEYKVKYPNKTDLEIAQLISGNLTKETAKSCSIFPKIMQKISIPEYNSSNQSVKNVSEKVCDFMEKNKTLSYDDLDKLIGNKIFEMVLPEKELIEKEYGEFGGKNFYGDLNGYLMENCELFLKVAMARQKQ